MKGIPSLPLSQCCHIQSATHIHTLTIISLISQLVLIRVVSSAISFRCVISTTTLSRSLLWCGKVNRNNRRERAQHSSHENSIFASLSLWICGDDKNLSGRFITQHKHRTLSTKTDFRRLQFCEQWAQCLTKIGDLYGSFSDNRVGASCG